MRVVEAILALFGLCILIMCGVLGWQDWYEQYRWEKRKQRTAPLKEQP